ncbi:MAG: hypothetical protein QM756_10255 [Polyangiaceae bacterium]
MPISTETSFRWLCLLVTLGFAACTTTTPDPPPPAARNDFAVAPPGARGAHPASSTERPLVVEPPSPRAAPAPPLPEPDPEQEDEPEADAGVELKEPKPDGVAL